MARNYNGTSDFIDWGSDASIDDLVPMTISFHVNLANITNDHPFLAKRGYANGWFFGFDSVLDKLDFEFNFTTTRGIWAGSTVFVAGTNYHIVLTYDKNAAAGTDPVIYVNGVAETITENSTPVGTPVSDAVEPMNSGKDDSFDTAFLSGKLGWLCYASGAWDAAAVNRARWWGRPHGGIAVYHPLVSGKLTNEGTATANGTATGTTVANMVTSVVRPGSAMMGMGIGW